MTETMPNWPELWAREPGLRPEGVNGDRLRINPDFPANFEWHHECDDPCHQASGTTRRPVWIDDAAALCRDAAVRWLHRFGISVAHIRGNFGPFVCLEEDRLTGAQKLIVNPDYGPDYDRALFATCEQQIARLGSAPPP